MHSDDMGHMSPRPCQLRKREALIEDAPDTVCLMHEDLDSYRLVEVGPPSTLTAQYRII